MVGCNLGWRGESGSWEHSVNQCGGGAGWGGDQSSTERWGAQDSKEETLLFKAGRARKNEVWKVNL